MEVYISLDGESLTCVGNYQPSESVTCDSPGCDEDFEIENVVFNGVDILSWLNKDTMDRLRDSVLEEIKEDVEADKYEERHFGLVEE